MNQKVYIVVWKDDDHYDAQAYETREAAERDFPEFSGAEIIESTVQS